MNPGSTESGAAPRHNGWSPHTRKDTKDEEPSEWSQLCAAGTAGLLGWSSWHTENWRLPKAREAVGNCLRDPGIERPPLAVSEVCNPTVHVVRYGTACTAWPVRRGLHGVACTAWPVWCGLYGVACTAWPVWRGMCGAACMAWPVRRGLYGVACVVRPVWRGCSLKVQCRPVLSPLRAAAGRPLRPQSHGSSVNSKVQR